MSYHKLKKKMKKVLTTPPKCQVHRPDTTRINPNFSFHNVRCTKNTRFTQNTNAKLTQNTNTPESPSTHVRLNEERAERSEAKF